MPYFLDTRGQPTLGIGICDRCRKKYPLAELHPDPNSPGLRVCVADMDQYDPYRLPARQTERINLPFVRPDQPLDGFATPYLDLVFLVAENADPLLAQNGSNFEAEL